MVPVHPGSVLREELEVRSLSANALSRAAREFLGRFFGNDAEFWMALQAQYDVALARRLLGKKLEREVLPADKAA